MEKQKEKDNLKETMKARRYTSSSHSAMDRCKAVLSVWTERRKPSEVCREMGLKWMTFHQWQKRALEGMLQALEPRVNLGQGPALSLKLQTMLEKREEKLLHRPTSADARLDRRLRTLLDTKTEKKAQETAKP